ncbi:MAG: hypothetical protein IKX56_05715, partial [Muribaculaceae bacterium]|nr:hypothetical protein [Muribaculaceae bacterium]
MPATSPQNHNDFLKLRTFSSAKPITRIWHPRTFIQTTDLSESSDGLTHLLFYRRTFSSAKPITRIWHPRTFIQTTDLSESSDGLTHLLFYRRTFS